MPRTRGRRRLLPIWLRHHRLVASEAILVIGALRSLLDQRLMASSLPAWAKVLLEMGLTVGVFGGLLCVVQTFTASGVARTHDLIQAAPIPLPGVVAHLLVFAGLMALYWWVMGQPSPFR